MKLTALLVSISCLTAQAFNPTPQTSLSKNVASSESRAVVSGLKNKGGPATSSLLFRDQSLTRGGAVPGWAAYNEALDKTPITAKALTSFTGFLLGDLLTQLFLSKSAFDVKRLLILSFFGLIYHGPSGHFFYNFLDSKIKGTDAKSVASKVLIDQILWCPIFMIVFFSYTGLAAGDTLAAIGNKIKTDLFTAVQGSWRLWPIVHAVNFKFISTKHRLLFLNGVQILFNMFLSLMATK